MGDGTEGPMWFRLYTQDKPNLDNLAAQFFPGGATIHHGLSGVWNLEKETSAVIEVLDLGINKGDDYVIPQLSARYRMEELAQEIKRINNQQTVLVLELPVEARLL